MVHQSVRTPGRGSDLTHPWGASQITDQRKSNNKMGGQIWEVKNDVVVSQMQTDYQENGEKFLFYEKNFFFNKLQSNKGKLNQVALLKWSVVRNGICKII